MNYSFSFFYVTSLIICNYRVNSCVWSLKNIFFLIKILIIIIIIIIIIDQYTVQQWQDEHLHQGSRLTVAN